jgi:hypothetical protein
MNDNLQSNVPRATSEVEEHGNALQNEIDILHENLTTLENVLLPIIKPYGESVKQGSAPTVGIAEDALSPVGDRFRSARRQIGGINDRINNLKGKLAV